MLLPLLMNLGMFADAPNAIRNFSLRNWRKWRKDEEEEVMEELEQAAEAAVKVAEQTSAALQAGKIDPGLALLREMEARQRYEEAYRAALREAYVADIVSRQWMEDMKRYRRRRAAVMLLLH